MSSEESAAESSDAAEDDNDGVPKSGKKKLIRQRLPWRSVEFQSFMESLDRKIERRRTDRSRSMCLEVEVGNVTSIRQAPAEIPEWAKELFS